MNTHLHPQSEPPAASDRPVSHSVRPIRDSERLVTRFIAVIGVFVLGLVASFVWTWAKTGGR